MYLVINKCVTAAKVSNFSCHYLRNRSTLDIGVLGYIGIVQHKEHSRSFVHFSWDTLYICVCVCVCVCMYVHYVGVYAVWEQSLWALLETPRLPNNYLSFEFSKIITSKKYVGHLVSHRMKWRTSIDCVPYIKHSVCETAANWPQLATFGARIDPILMFVTGVPNVTLFRQMRPSTNNYGLWHPPPLDK